MTLRAEKLVVSLALSAILHPTFQWVAAVSGTRSIPAPWWLVTPIDRAIPVIPAAVWLYVSWYPASALGLFADRTTLRRLYISYVVAFLVCVASYLVLPVTIDRPLIEGDSASAALLRAVYAADRPTNLFPSFHAAVASILLHVRPRRRLLGIGLAVWMIVICAACVLTKQHYVLDVLAGLFVGLVAVRVADTILAQVVAPRSPIALTTSEGGTVTNDSLA